MDAPPVRLPSAYKRVSKKVDFLLRSSSAPQLQQPDDSEPAVHRKARFLVDSSNNMAYGPTSSFHFTRTKSRRNKLKLRFQQQHEERECKLKRVSASANYLLGISEQISARATSRDSIATTVAAGAVSSSSSASSSSDDSDDDNGSSTRLRFVSSPLDFALPSPHSARNASDDEDASPPPAARRFRRQSTPMRSRSTPGRKSRVPPLASPGGASRGLRRKRKAQGKTYKRAALTSAAKYITMVRYTHAALAEYEEVKKQQAAAAGVEQGQGMKRHSRARISLDSEVLGLDFASYERWLNAEGSRFKIDPIKFSRMVLELDDSKEWSLPPLEADLMNDLGSFKPNRRISFSQSTSRSSTRSRAPKYILSSVSGSDDNGGDDANRSGKAQGGHTSIRHRRMYSRDSNGSRRREKAPLMTVI